MAHRIVIDNNIKAMLTCGGRARRTIWPRSTAAAGRRSPGRAAALSLEYVACRGAGGIEKRPEKRRRQEFLFSLTQSSRELDLQRCPFLYTQAGKLVSLHLQPLIVQSAFFGIPGDHLEHSCGFGKDGIGQPGRQFLRGRFVGPAEKVQPRFDRVGDDSIIARWHVLRQLEKVNSRFRGLTASKTGDGLACKLLRKLWRGLIQRKSGKTSMIKSVSEKYHQVHDVFLPPEPDGENPGIGPAESAVAMAAAIGAAFVTRRLLQGGWRATFDRPPPKNPASREVDWGDALLWGAVSGAIVGVARIASRRAASSAYHGFRR